MLKPILYIIILSITGIAAFVIFLNYILNKIFYLPHVRCKKTPKDFNLDFTERFVETRHQKKVQVWDINPASNGPILLAVHGWANTSDSFLELAVRMDCCRMLLLNTRSHGDSDDAKYMNLIKYSEDITAVVNALEREEDELPPVILLGHSLGGAASLWAAVNDQRISGVITIGTFADLETMMREGFIKNKLPKNMIGSLLTYIEFRIGEKMQAISPVYTIASFTGPVLLVHGTKDEVVDFTDMNRIRKAALRENVDQLVMKGFGHSDLLADAELAEEIKKFLIKHTFLKANS